MTTEYKTLPIFTKDIDTESRVVVGIGAVHGNIDAGGDMSLNGSFEKRWSDGSRKRQRYLWNHNGMNPPIATILKMREVSRAELPDKVLQYAPEATGGVEITRKYYPGGIETLPGWVFHSLQMGDVEEMSYAYEVHDSEMKTINGRNVRVLKDIENFDWSDVNWGMNGATAAVKNFANPFENLNPLVSGELSFIQHSEAVVSIVEELSRRAKDKAAFRLKEGRVLSTANRERLSRLMAMMQEVTADISALMDSTMPKPIEEEEDAEEMGKGIITPAQYLALLALSSQNRIAISTLGQ